MGKHRPKTKRCGCGLELGADVKRCPGCGSRQISTDTHVNDAHSASLYPRS